MPPVIVHYVGDAVVLGAVETVAATTNAAELVDIDYKVLPVLAAALDAKQPGAPQVWQDGPDNLSLV